MPNNAPTIPGAVMLDRVISEIQTGLVDGLSWLDVAFGRAQRIIKVQNGRRLTLPMVFCGGWNGHGENDYIEVGPDKHLGNFAYFEVDDPETIDAGPWARTITSPFSIVFWFDLRTIEDGARNIERLKGQVLYLLAGRTGWKLDNGRVSVARVYEHAQNIYRGYSLDEVDAQFLMHPYGGFRIDGVLEFNEICYE